jgi:glycerol-3-phosphate acyltransferase PlsY
MAEFLSAFSGAHLMVAMAAYIVGSIPFGLVLTRAAGGGDIRDIGSGNVGATNVLRTGKKKIAALTLVLDGFKGAAPVLLAQHWHPDLAVVAGFSAVVGHCFPLWLNYKGGKGVATTFGVFLAVAWPVGLLAIGVWIVIAALFRISSLAALVALAAAPVFAWWIVGNVIGVLCLLLAILGFLRHGENITRLISGTESRIGSR